MVELPESCDVAVVGGGPAGCAAAVFTGRYGLETVVFDRGSGSLDRSAFLANYLGFPAGIDVETFQAMAQEQAREVGCTVVDDLVESVERVEEAASGDSVAEDDPVDDRFVLDTQDGRGVRARYLVAATRYDGSYLRPLDGDAMFVTHTHGGEEHEHFDPEYADEDGRTPVEGLYVASPAGERDAQAVVAAGQGAHVARCLLKDHRKAVGYPGGLATHYDWLRPDSEFAGEWADRDRWRESFEARAPEDHDLPDERFAELRERFVDRAFGTHVPDEEVSERTERAQRRLLEFVDDDLICAYADGIEGTD